MISAEDLAAYAAGDAGPALVARVESALGDDPSLARRLDAIRRVDEHLSAWEVPTMGEDGATRLLAAVDADLATFFDTSPPAGAADEAPTPGPAVGGVEAVGARPATAGTVDRVRGWWRDHVGRPEDLLGWAGGLAAAAVVVVIGVAVVSSGIGGGADDSADTAAMEAAPAGEADDAGSAEGFASGGTQAMTEGEMSESAMSESEASSEGGAGSAMRSIVVPPVVDDGRVVASLDDIDPGTLRDRLEPLVPLIDPGGAVDGAADGGAPTADLDAPEEETMEETEASGEDLAEPTPLANSRVAPNDLEAVAACRPGGDDQAIVAEITTLSPARDVILYVYPDRVVAVEVAACRTLAVRSG